MHDNFRRRAADEDHRSVAGGLLVDGRRQLRADERNQLFISFVVAHGSIMTGSEPNTKSASCRWAVPIIRGDQAEAGVGTGRRSFVVQNWTEELKRLAPVN